MMWTEGMFLWSASWFWPKCCDKSNTMFSCIERMLLTLLHCWCSHWKLEKRLLTDFPSTWDHSECVWWYTHAFLEYFSGFVHVFFQLCIQGYWRVCVCAVFHLWISQWCLYLQHKYKTVQVLHMIYIWKRAKVPRSDKIWVLKKYYRRYVYRESKVQW